MTQQNKLAQITAHIILRDNLINWHDSSKASATTAATRSTKRLPHQCLGEARLTIRLLIRDVILPSIQRICTTESGNQIGCMPMMRDACGVLSTSPTITGLKQRSACQKELGAPGVSALQLFWRTLPAPGETRLGTVAQPARPSSFRAPSQKP